MLQRSMARRLWIACARRQCVDETAAVLWRLEFCTADDRTASVVPASC
ncbi:unnamed protein product [Pelagomonas calceolata]|uniref:Uncharacterized protein n=1 Tax=Pelagomonas calceolata TaxID=35677 RepID=A0A8J2SE95_9STRA|nr:unnamed protein product [Pelagomonas calceolata]